MRDPNGPIIINPFLIGAIAVMAWMLDQFLPSQVGVQPVYAIWNFVVQIAIIAVSVIISYALTPKPKPPKPASLADFDAPTAEEGRPIPVVFGAVLLRGANVVWYGDLEAEPIKKKGGKK